MPETSTNLLDLLDQLRELPAAEQERRLAEVSPESRAQLRQWLEVAQRPADPFEAVANALAGADPELLSKLRENLSKLQKSRAPAATSDPNRHAHTTQSVSPVDYSVGRVVSAGGGPRKVSDGRLNFQAGDVLLKQFRIVCQLGRGGMGEVFRAIDEHAGEQVALKFLPADRMANPEALALLKSEVRVAHLVRSPYVCAVHGLYIESDPRPGQPQLPPFLAMQFIEGEDLHTLLRRVERLSGPKVVRIAHELTQGMAAIHAAGILHRDLKPSNVMLDVQGMVQILDFGIASLATPAEPESQIIAGTPAYMAPEARTENATPASDIYSLGLLLFELTTGQMASRLIAQNIEPIQILEQFKDQIPRELIDAIARCIRPNPADRFASMQELLQALPAPAAQRGGRSESISTIAKSDAVPALKPWMIAAVMAFIIAAGVAVFFIPSRAGSAAATHLIRDPANLMHDSRKIAGLFNAQHDPFTAHGFTGATVDGRRQVHFWYRSGQAALEPLNAARGVSATDPPPARGTTTIVLDTDGVLIEAFRQPAVDQPAPTAADYDFPLALAKRFTDLRDLIGQRQVPLESVTAAELPADWVPPVPFPAATMFWMEPAPADPAAIDCPLIVALYASKPVYIGRPGAVVRRALSSDGWPSPTGTIIRKPQYPTPPALPSVGVPGPPPVTLAPPPAPGAAPMVPPAFAWLDSAMHGPVQWFTGNTTQDYAFWWMYAMPIFGLGLAARNIRLRRCDTRHALRVAGVVCALSFVGWMLTTHPSVSGKSMSERWNIGIGLALFVGAEAWISYAAVDPYARLTWKRCLIGYARLTSGWPRAILRDRIVGRSILAGAAYGLSLALLLKTLDLWSLASTTASVKEQLAATLLGDGLRTLGLLSRSASTAIVFSLLQFVTLVLLHWLTRRKRVAIALFCVVTPLLWAVYRGDFAFPAYLIYPLIGLLTAIALIHEGVLTTAVGLFFSAVLTTVPFTFDSSAPYFESSILIALLLGAVVIAALVAVLPKGMSMRLWPSDPISQRTIDTPRTEE